MLVIYISLEWLHPEVETALSCDQLNSDVRVNRVNGRLALGCYDAHGLYIVIQPCLLENILIYYQFAIANLWV